jgi:hypothetical protein
MSVTTLSGAKRPRPNTIPFSSDPGDIPIDVGGEGLFPGLFPDPFVPTSSPGGNIDFPSDFPAPDPEIP